MLTHRKIRSAAALAVAAFLWMASGESAEAQFYTASPQATPQASPQSTYPCVCPFPQGYCPFPSGSCALPCGAPLGSPQGNWASNQMTTSSPQYTVPNYTAKPYPTPTYYYPKPLGIPAGSVPSSQGAATGQFHPGMIGD